MLMLSARFSSLSLLLLLIFHTTTVIAQDVKTEQAKLTAFQQQLAELNNQQQQLQQALQQSKAALAPLASSASPEKAVLDVARTELEEALENQAAEPGDTNEARVKNAEFKLALAERKFRKANEEQFELEAQVDSLTTTLTELNGSIATLNRSIEQQKQKVVQSRQQQIATAQARQEQTQRQKALAAEQEIARLKAKLAEQERVETELKAKALAAEKAALALATQQSAVTTTPATASPATTQPTVATSPAPTTVAESAATNTSPQTQLASLSAPVAESATNKVPASSSGGSGIIFLDSAEAVQAERQRLAQILAQPEENKSPGYNKILNVKAIGEGGTTGPAIAHGLRPKGHNIYQGTADLAAGDTLFIVGFNRWQQQVEAISTGPENIFIVTFDGSDPKKPKLIYYPQSLDI